MAEQFLYTCLILIASYWHSVALARVVTRIKDQWLAWVLQIAASTLAIWWVWA